MARGYPDGKPRLYAQEKLKALKGRKADNIIGSATARMVDIAFPTAPAEVFHGFTSFATSPKEDTADAGNPFHEIGLYQVEAGLSGRSAPNQDPDAEYSNWAKLAGSALVKEMLGGRSATMVKGQWKTKLEDQIAVGLANLRYHATLMTNALPGQLKKHDLPKDLANKLRPNQQGSNWDVMWAFTAYSRGEGQFFSVLLPYIAALVNEPEDVRWLRLRKLVEHDIVNNASGIGRKRGKTGAAYALIRTEQKYQSGYLLAKETNASTDWFGCAYLESRDDIAVEDHIARVAYPK